MKKQLTKTELDNLSIRLDELEYQTLIDAGLINTSGSFADTNIIDYDNKIIDINLKFGVQSDCDNETYEEQLQIDRNTFEIIN